MVLGGEHADGEEELIPPAAVVASRDFEDDRDQTPDIVGSHALRVEVHKGGSLVKEQCMVEVAGTVIRFLLVVAFKASGDTLLFGVF